MRLGPFVPRGQVLNLLCGENLKAQAVGFELEALAYWFLNGLRKQRQVTLNLHIKHSLLIASTELTQDASLPNGLVYGSN